MAVGLNVDLPREQPSSRYQHVSLRFKHFFARKVMFARFASAYVVLPGGYGTLDELFEALTPWCTSPSGAASSAGCRSASSPRA